MGTPISSTFVEAVTNFSDERKNFDVLPRVIPFEKPLEKVYSMVGVRNAGVKVYATGRSLRKGDKTFHEAVIVTRKGVIPGVIADGKYLIPGFGFRDAERGSYVPANGVPLPGGILNYPVINGKIGDAVIFFPDLKRGVLERYHVITKAFGYTVNGVRVKTITPVDAGLLVNKKFVYTLWKGEDLFWLADFSGSSKVRFTANPTVELVRTDLAGLHPVSVEEFSNRKSYKKFYERLGYRPTFHFNVPVNKAGARNLIWIEPMLAPAVYYLSVETRKFFVITRRLPGNKVEARVVLFRHKGDGYVLGDEDFKVFTGKRKVRPARIV